MLPTKDLPDLSQILNSVFPQTNIQLDAAYLWSNSTIYFLHTPNVLHRVQTGRQLIAFFEQNSFKETHFILPSKDLPDL